LIILSLRKTQGDCYDGGNGQCVVMLFYVFSITVSKKFILKDNIVRNKLDNYGNPIDYKLKVILIELEQ